MSEEIQKPQPTGTALAQTSNDRAFDRMSELLKQADQLGQWIGASGMFGCEKIEQGKILALSALLERRTPIDLLRRQHLMFGRLTMRSDAMLAEFCARSGNKWEWIHLGDDKTDATAKVTTPQQTMTISFSWADAEKAGYSHKINKDGSPNQYQKDPGAMLRARLITKAIRILAPDVIVGVRSMEEMSEEVADTVPTINLAPGAQPSAPAPRVLEAQTQDLGLADFEKGARVAPVTARVAREMKERAEQPLPADIQPSAPLPQTSDKGTDNAAAPVAPTKTPQPERADAESTSGMTLETQAWLAKWCEPVGVAAAIAFMRAKEWLPKDGMIEDLSPEFVAQIKRKPVVVLNLIKAHAAKTSPA